MLSLFSEKFPIVGVVYLRPMPGYDGHPGMKELIRMALEDATRLAAGGVDGVLIENEMDRPHKLTANAEVIAAMSSVAKVCVDKLSLPVGVEFLLNDPKASLAIAHAAGAQFIRTDYWVDRMTRPEYCTEMKINAPEVIRYRDEILKNPISIFADIQVKYAQMLESKTLRESAIEAFEAKAAVVIVSGNKTGESAAFSDVRLAKARPEIPVWLGSGVDRENLASYFKEADGAIVGTAFMSEGRIDQRKVEQFVQRLLELRGQR